MKNLFNRIISLICAVTLLICVLSVCAAAENEPASFTDLPETNLSEEQPEVIPENDQDEAEAVLDEAGDRSEDNDEKEPEAEPGEEDASDESSENPVDSVEILITKTMILGESWEGRTRNTRLVILKLDIEKEQTVHMIVEGKNTWANVQKSDRTEENLRKVLTDPETKRAIITWEAEEGSYLITIGPEEPNLMSQAKVTFLDDEAYAAWEETLEEETEEEPEEEEEPEATDEEKEEKEDEQVTADSIPEEMEDEGNEEDESPIDVLALLPEDRSISYKVFWDVENPAFGDTAHFVSSITGYDLVDYSIQWQYSEDDIHWNDIYGATDETMDVVASEENYLYFWRVMVYIYLPQE